MFKPVLVAVFLWQSSVLVDLGAPAAPEYLHYQRAVWIARTPQISTNPQIARNPQGVNGVACVALDAATLAHTASAAHNDLRLYRTTGGGTAGGGTGEAAQVEVPYLFTESGPEPLDAVQAKVQHPVTRGRELQFELQMPARPYSELQLQLRARDFVGTAVLTAGGDQERPKTLGSFGIFDLSSLGLGHWTDLSIAETSAPVLHLTLVLRRPDGQALDSLSPNILAGVAVPPSRERQTVYTPVASTRVFVQRGRATVATLHVAAHVPVEQLRFTLRPGAHTNFAREVRVTARADDEPFNEPETMDAGSIEDVRLPSGDPRVNPIDVQENSLHATLGATLASAATVEVAVENGSAPPLPLASATLEMRERRLCFPVVAQAAYTLRYGDRALSAPLYADRPQIAAGIVAVAELGPERLNPDWISRRDSRPFLDRHPEVFWLMVLACAGTLGGTALQFVQGRREETRR